MVRIKDPEKQLRYISVCVLIALGPNIQASVFKQLCICHLFVKANAGLIYNIDLVYIYFVISQLTNERTVFSTP